jgi:methyl-accepting chemotaxis protein
MSHPQRRKFRSHLVNHEVRLRLVLDDMAFAFIAALAAIGILYFLSNREIGDSLWSAHLSIKETKELLNKGVIVAGIVTFFGVLLFGFWSMIDAHRIAGPMHRLRFLLDEIAGGNLTHEIIFRKKDEFHDIAASVDALVDAHALHAKNVVGLANSIQGAASRLTGSDATELQELATRLQTEISFYRLPEEAK